MRLCDGQVLLPTLASQELLAAVAVSAAIDCTWSMRRPLSAKMLEPGCQLVETPAISFDGNMQRLWLVAPPLSGRRESQAMVLDRAPRLFAKGVSAAWLKIQTPLPESRISASSLCLASLIGSSLACRIWPVSSSRTTYQSSSDLFPGNASILTKHMSADLNVVGL